MFMDLVIKWKQQKLKNIAMINIRIFLVTWDNDIHLQLTANSKWLIASIYPSTLKFLMPFAHQLNCCQEIDFKFGYNDCFNH